MTDSDNVTAIRRIAVRPNPDGYRLECLACGAAVDVKAKPGVVDTTMHHEPDCGSLLAVIAPAGGTQ